VLSAVATLGVVTYRMGSRQLWRDEIATWSASTRSVADLFRLLRNTDAVLGPYYLFMHGWITVFGDSTVALRAPSVLAMVAAAALIATLGRRLFGTWAGLCAGLIFAVLPATSRYGQEARPYAFATLFAVLATLLLVEAVRRPTWAHTAVYTVSVIALGLAQITALLLLTGHAFAVVAHWRHGGARFAPRWIAGLCLAGLALLPLAVLGRAQQNRQIGWLGTPTWPDLRNLPANLVLSAMVAGVILGMALLGAGREGRSGSDGYGRRDGHDGRDGYDGPWAPSLAMQVALPVSLLYIGGLLTPLFIPRYLTFTLPFVCVLAGVAAANARLPAALAAIMLTGVLGWSDQSRIRTSHVTRGGATIDYAAAAEVVRRHEQPGDGIVFAPRHHTSMLDLAISYRLRGAMPIDVLLAKGQTDTASFWASECPQPARCLSRVRRLWLLTNGSQPDPLRTMEPAKAAAIRAEFTVVRIQTVNGITIDLATRR
jgi:mannosyltransferase